MVLLPEHALYVPVCYAQPPGSLCLPADLGSPAGLSDLPAIHSVAAVPGERQTALSSQADWLAAAAPDALLHVAVVEPVAALAVSMTVAVALTVAAPDALLHVAVVPAVEKMHLPLWTLTQFRSLQQSEQYFDERIDRPLVL